MPTQELLTLTVPLKVFAGSEIDGLQCPPTRLNVHCDGTISESGKHLFGGLLLQLQVISYSLKCDCRAPQVSEVQVDDDQVAEELFREQQQSKGPPAPPPATTASNGVAVKNLHSTAGESDNRE